MSAVSGIFSSDNLKKAFDPKSVIEGQKYLIGKGGILYDPAGVVTQDEDSPAGGVVGPIGQFAADPMNLTGVMTPPAVEAPTATPSVDTAAVQAAAAAAKRRASGSSTQVSGQLSTPSIGTTTLLGR